MTGIQEMYRLKFNVGEKDFGPRSRRLKLIQ